MTKKSIALSGITLMKSFVYMMTSSGGALLLMLGSTLLLAYYLSPEELGIMLTAEAFVGLFSLFFEFGFSNSIVKFTSKHKSIQDGINTAVGNALFIKTVVSVPLAILIFLAGMLMKYDSLASYILICFILIHTSDSFAKIFGIARRTLGQFKIMAFVNVFNPALRIITIFIVLGVFHSDLKAIVHCFLALSLIRFLVSFLSTAKLVQPKVDFSQLKKMFQESYNYGLYDFLEDLQTRIDRVMINYFIGAANVAYYSIPAKINTLVKIIPTTLSQVFLPTLHAHYEESHEKYKKLSKNLSRYIALIAALIFLAIFYFSEPVLTKLYGDKYAESIPIVQLFAFVSLAWLLNSTPSLILATQSAHKPRIISQVIATIVNITMNVCLIPKFGIVGAVYATLSSNAIKLVFLNILTREYIENLKIFFITCTPIALALLLKFYIAIPIYVAAIFVFGWFSKKDLKINV